MFLNRPTWKRIGDWCWDRRDAFHAGFFRRLKGVFRGGGLTRMRYPRAPGLVTWLGPGRPPASAAGGSSRRRLIRCFGSTSAEPARGLLGVLRQRTRQAADAASWTARWSVRPPVPMSSRPTAATPLDQNLYQAVKGMSAAPYRRRRRLQRDGPPLYEGFRTWQLQHCCSTTTLRSR